MTAEIITVSRLNSWRRCARHHEIAYNQRIRPVHPKDALAFGTLFHVGAEAWWKTDNLEQAKDAIRAAGRDLDPVLVLKATTMMDVYATNWQDRDEYEILAVEQGFRAPLVNPQTMASSRTFDLAGKIDLVLRRKADGATILVEHKTSTSDISDDAAQYWKKLAMDSQLSLYVTGAMSLGYKIDEIIYDVVARPEIEPLKATPIEKRKYTKEGRLYAAQREHDETLAQFEARLREDIADRPARYARRKACVRLDAELEEGLQDAWHDARMIREAQLAGRAPRNTAACTSFGTCEYWEICALGVDPLNSAEFHRLATPYPELVGVIEATPAQLEV